MSLSGQLAQLSPRALATVVFVSVFGGFLATVSGFYLHAVSSQEAALRRHVRDQALLAAGSVDVARHEQLVDPTQEGSEDYYRVLAPLRELHRRHPHIQYLWTVRVTKADRQIFVLETSVDPEIRRVQAALGRSQDLLPFLGPNSAETPAGAASLPTLRAGEPLVFPIPYEDDHGVYIEARAPLRDATGRFVGYLGLDYGLDSFQEQVNELRQLGLLTLGLAFLLATVLARAAAEMRRVRDGQRAEIERERDRADRASEAKGELLRIAAHDLKNPLAAIAGMSALLLKQWRKRSDQPAGDAQVLETIQDSAQHMSEIVRGILMNEGLEQGGLTCEPAPTDLAGLARVVLKFNAASAERKGIALRAELAPGLMATVDAKLIREAFDNYLSNALKYSPRGKTVWITLQADPAGTVEFAVRDEGPGLSPEDQAHLFEKFRKLKPRPTGGESSTGLGLSIVKTIVEMHRGHVGCDTAPGHGARFWLRLPVAPV